MRSWRDIFITAAIAGVVTVSASELKAQEAPIEQPAVLQAVAPLFPMEFAFANTFSSFRVVAKVTINAAGEVIEARIIEGAPRENGSRIETAARRWRFSPITDAAKVRNASLVFKFLIIPKKAPEEELTTRFKTPYEVEVRQISNWPVVDDLPKSDQDSSTRPKEKRP